MINKQTVLYLYMVPETGHQKAADAIMKAMGYMDPRVQCVGLDAGTQTYPVLGNVFNQMYLQMLKTAPGIWDYLYDNPDVEEFTRDARALLTRISSYRIRKLLKKYQPSAVVCTQAAPAVALAAERRKGTLKVPLVAVVTDFGVHTYWYHQEVDLYLVAHEDLKKEMMARGIREHKIRVTGIPVMPNFGKTYDMVSERKKLKLNPLKKTILLMGGSRGMGSMDHLVEALQNIPYDFQTIVICGRNRKLLKTMNKLKMHRNNLHVFGYIKDLSPIMAASDVLITKPGGLTCSEAMAQQLPMVMSNPLPGQEEKNVRFLTKHHVAALARTEEDLIHTVSDLIRHPKKIAAMRHHIRLMSKPHSAWEASRTIIDLINKRDVWPSRDIN